MNEDAPTMSTATAGGAGFSHSAAATGPNAGVDPVLKFRKKLQKRKKQMMVMMVVLTHQRRTQQKQRRIFC